MDVQGVSQSITCSVDVQGVQYICIPFHMKKSFFKCRMPDFPASGQSGTGMN
jgi:hypothetical protein